MRPAGRRALAGLLWPALTLLLGMNTMGCDDKRMGTYEGRLMATVVLDRPVKNDTRTTDPARVELAEADGKVQVKLPGCAVLAEKSDSVGLEVVPGQTCAVEVDGESRDFEVEGSGQVTEEGFLTFIFIGRHADGETTWEFNGNRR